MADRRFGPGSARSDVLGALTMVDDHHHFGDQAVNVVVALNSCIETPSLEQTSSW
jgi:hypothetical protein